MRKKKYNKYTSIPDRFPFIPVIIVIGMAILFFFIFRAQFPLAFFSGSTEQPETEETSSYSIYVNSPSDEQVFKFVNINESVPIEIASKDIENLDYKLKLVINDDETIKTFNSPPYEFNWNPEESGDYELVANLVDDEGNIISSSNKVSFSVEYSNQTIETIARSMDVEEKKAAALDDSDYRPQNGPPIFSFKCYTPPVIDGVMDEWEMYDKTQIANPTIKKENFTSIRDCSGIISTCWDEEAFYFIVQVSDDVFNQNFTGNQINNGDSLTLVFDTDLSGDFSIPFYNSDDSQIDFSPGNFSGIPAEAFIYFPSRTASGIQVKASQQSQGYIIEAGIPWENFVSYGPTDMAVIGFTASIFDTDNLESTELAMSTSPQFEINNVTTLGTLAFIDGGDLTGESEESTESTETEEST